MADSTVALVAKMSVQLTDLEKGMKKAGLIADKGVKDIEKKFASANPKLPAGFGTAFAAGIAGFVSVETLKRLREAVGLVADMADEAERVGVSTDYFQAFAYAVKLAGGTTEDASTALERMNKQLSDAAHGTSDLGRIFKANGVSIRDTSGNIISTADAMAKFSDLVKNTRDPVDQLALSVRIFGKQAGPAMVLALKDGQKGLQDAADEAERLGIIMDKSIFQNARAIDDELTKLETLASAWAKSLAVTLVTNTLPALSKAYNLISEIISILPGTTRTISDVDREIGLLQNSLGPNTLDFQRTSINNAITRLQAERAARVQAGEAVLTVDMGTGTGTNRPTVIPPQAAPGRGPRERGAETIEDLRNELAKVQAIGEAREDIIAKERIITELRHANVDATSEEGKEIARLVKQIEEETRAQKKLTEAMDDFRDVASTGIKTFFGDLLEGKSIIEALNDSLQNMLQTILNIAEQQLITGLFGQQGTPGGGALSGILSSLLGRQGGGDVSANRPYVVGEHGPELLVPKTAGTIIPNNALAAPDKGGGVQINIINQSGSQIQQRERNQGGRPIIDILVAEVGKRIGGGDFDAAMRGRYGARPIKVR